MKRKHKKYSKPKKSFDKPRIEEEVEIKEEFGLKKKREIWKAEAKVKKMREKAKNLISASPELQEKLFENLRKSGFKVNSISDILSLDKKDYLRRRLQTVLVEKHMATTPKAARQLIVHKKVLVDGNIVSIPSYIVPVELEKSISLKIKTKPVKEKVKMEEIANE
ncbi:MAG: 30S ribosomal protein S4 [Nanoarchaeota archaeon]|nr:30S ribosomal protein S4 [Nanoarchaeota archaeon]